MPFVHLKRHVEIAFSNSRCKGIEVFKRCDDVSSDVDIPDDKDHYLEHADDDEQQYSIADIGIEHDEQTEPKQNFNC